MKLGPPGRHGRSVFLVGAGLDRGVVDRMPKSLGASPSGPGSTLQPQAASAAIPDAECDTLDAIEHAQDRDYWRTERERLDSIDKDDHS